MNLTITDNSNISIEGKSLGEHLTTGLNNIESKSPTHATALFQTAETGNVEIEVVSAQDVTGAHATGNKVSLSTDVIYIDNIPANGLKADGIKELVESSLFEIKNAINAQRYDLETAAIKNGTKTLKAYGEAYSDIESESCWVVKKILTEAEQNDYTASTDWGKKLLTKYQGASSLNEAKAITSTSPHKPGANNYFALNTPEMYAFEYVLNLGNQQKVLNSLIDKAVKQIRYAPMGGVVKTYKVRDIWNTIRGRFYGQPHDKITDGSGGDYCTTFYHFFIDVLDYLTGLGFGQKGTWMVTWTGGSAQGWQFSNAMKRHTKKQEADSALKFIKDSIPTWQG